MNGPQYYRVLFLLSFVWFYYSNIFFQRARFELEVVLNGAT